VVTLVECLPGNLTVKGSNEAIYTERKWRKKQTCLQILRLQELKKLTMTTTTLAYRYRMFWYLNYNQFIELIVIEQIDKLKVGI
jgi:hypothetical protein